MLPYFPFDADEYALTMGVRALAPDCLIEVDPAHYRAELALKGAILAGDYRYYYQAAQGTMPLQWEALELLLPNLARHHSQHFTLARSAERWTWTNHLLGAEVAFTLGDPASLPLPPLDWLGRQVQEDLLIMAGDVEAGTPLVAGQLCFAAGWCLDDKLGRPFLAIHDPVPQFAERIGRASNLLMERLKPGHPTGRVGWSITVGDDLNRAPIVADRRRGDRREITADNAGERCYLRLERQTFSRLPRTWGILFTIHTYRAPIAAVAGEPERARRLAAVLRTMPPAVRAYKGLTPYADSLIAFLEARGRR